ALQTELAIIQAVEAGVGKGRQIATKQQIQSGLVLEPKLNAGQREAIITMLTSHDSILGVQGYAGTGKTTLLKMVRYIAEQAGFKVEGIAPTAVAARKLQDETGIRAETLSRKLISLQQHQAKKSNTLYILDESSMVSNREMLQLTQLLSKQQ